MILNIVVFLLGLHAMIELLAAAYGIIDLWYRIKDFWFQIAVRISLIVAAIILIHYLLPQEFKDVFAAGLTTYLIFHIMMFGFGRFGTGLLSRRR